MSALPPSLPPDGNEAESLAQLAVQISDLTALLKRENDGRLSPAEVALIPEANVQPKAAPVWEGDAKLTFCDTSIDLGIAVFGRRVPAMPARADTPAEPAFVEIDSVIAFGEGYDIDIYDALSWADLQNISDAIMEAK